MQSPAAPDQLKQITELLSGATKALQQLANRKETVPTWAVGLGGSVLGFLFAIISEPIKQSLARAADRNKLYDSLRELYAFASGIHSFQVSLNQPRSKIDEVLEQEDWDKITEVNADVKKRYLQLLTLVNFEVFSYYHDVARDRFYAIREWAMLVHLFDKGMELVKSESWEEAADIASEIQDDADGAIERGELSVKKFRRAAVKSDERLRIHLAWAAQKKPESSTHPEYS
jgi:hypothetical protein